MGWWIWRTCTPFGGGWASVATKDITLITLYFLLLFLSFFHPLLLFALLLANFWFGKYPSAWNSATPLKHDENTSFYFSSLISLALHFDTSHLIAQSPCHGHYHAKHGTVLYLPFHLLHCHGNLTFSSLFSGRNLFQQFASSFKLSRLKKLSFCVFWSFFQDCWQYTFFFFFFFFFF